MDTQNTSQNGLAGAISSAIAPVLTQAQTGLIEDVNDTFGGQGGMAATPVASPATPSTPAAPSLTTPQPAVQPGFQPAMPIVPSRGGTGDPQILMRLLRNQEQMREQMDFMNRVNQSPFSGPLSGVSSPFPRSIGGVFGGTRLQPASDVPEPQSGPQYPAQMLAAGGKTEARAVQNLGRGDDTMLVHMTPGEVKGLQQLAMAYGGSLTINPETGLPEAGFLKSLLPTLIGAGLMMIPGVNAVAAPWMIGLGVGGVEAARTGDIGKGLMAGLGAYGGAGLASSALAAGAATGQAGATISAEELAKSQAIGSAPMSVPPQFTPPETFMGNLSQAGSGVSNIFSSGATGQVARDAAMQGFQDTGVEYAGLGSPTAATMKTVGALAAPLSQPAPMPEVEEVEYNYDGPYKPTKREVTYPGADRDPTDSSEFLYFRDSNPYPGFESAPAASSVTDLTGEPQFAGIPVSLATDPDRMRDYQTNPDLYRFAEGGTSAVTAPPEGYVAGRDAEHVYGFQPMSTDMPVVQETARVSRGIDSLAPTEAAKISVQVSDGGDGYERDPSLGPNNYNFNNNEGANYGYEYSDTAPSREDEQQSRAAAAAAAAMGYAMGGKTMDHGGFVIDAHTVSEIGNGSSDAGHSMLARIGGEPIKGAGNGTSDSIRANIGGVQEARIAKDENYFSKEDVKRLGGGNYKKGEKKLYALMKKAHESRKKNGRGQASGLDNLIARMA